MEARWWTSDKDEIICRLCFRQCRLKPGKRGVCTVRYNNDGVLESPYLGRFVSAAIDPIEKKPLYNWRPGSYIFSVGSLGCTMRCLFCQNSNIAQPTRPMKAEFLSPLAMLEIIKEKKLDSVAYTYNEPSLQAEYILEAAPFFNDENIATVLVTNGHMSKEVRDLLIPHVSAVNIDLKSFSPENYKRLGGDLDHVKESIRDFVRGGVHVETTCLVVPGISDHEGEFEAMTDWIKDLDPHIPLHISRYFPAHKYKEAPTDPQLMHSFMDIAKAKLKSVYFGNM